MNAFIPQNPRVVVMVNEEGDVVATINNIDSKLRVEVVFSEVSLNYLGAGLPFDSRNPCPQTQVLAAKKG